MCKNVSVVRIYVDSFIPSTAGMITGHVTCPPGERNNEMGSAVFVKFCVILPFPSLEESWGDWFLEFQQETFSSSMSPIYMYKKKKTKKIKTW